MDENELSTLADTMRERADESRAKVWLLITGNRWLVVGLILGLTFGLLVALYAVGPSSIRVFLTGQAIGTLFSSVIIAVVTAVTFVLTVSQIVLSQELGTLGNLRERMDEEISFRDDLEENSSVGVSPPEPSGFLRTVVETITERATALGDVARADDGVDGSVVDYAEAVADHGETVADDIEGEEFGSFDVLLPILNYNYAWKVYAAKHLREANPEASLETKRAFDELLTGLRFVGPAREYVKSKYLQWEFINLSRVMLYTAMPALALSTYLLLVFDAAEIVGVTAGIPNSYLVVALAFTLTLFPFAVLLSFLLRMLTVTKRTLSIGSFILRSTRRGTDTDAE
jgi:hypothetical protein